MNLVARRAIHAQRLEDALDRIVAVLTPIPGIRRVSVFGSYARGRRDLFTDLDLLVVWDTERSLLERLRFLYSAVDARVDLDVICYTPAELEALADQPFVRRLLGEEVVLYETNSA